jgi:hypothetical protein
MGKWKYVNWLITIIVVAHMYRYFLVRYEAAASVYILATAGWAVVGAIGYYIFVHRMRQSDKLNSKRMVETPIPKIETRERPKVAFKKKDQHGK